MKARPSIAVSACLLGEKVRYDGEHKLTDWVVSLASDFTLVTLCPEVAIGLGIPRPTIGLFMIDGQIRIHRHDDPAFDVSDKLGAFGRLQTEQEFCGYVLKARSPSCGIDDAALLDVQGNIMGTAPGGFVTGLLSELPGIPLINEEQLRDESMRQAFIESVHAYAEKLGNAP